VLCLLAIGAFAWPVYPSAQSICDMIAARNPLDRFASPHRGAVVTLRGMLYSGPPGVYVLQVTCRRDSPRVALKVPRCALATPATRRALGTLTRDHGVAVCGVARIESEIQGDFGYPMILGVWALRVTP
jgi:hypothetical protein